MNEIKRFENKFIPEPNSGCWLWFGALHNKLGYGSFRYLGNTVKAHRASWLIYNGKIEENKCVLHKCDNPFCVNPKHLFIGTQQDNISDMKAKGRAKGVVGSRHHNSKINEEQVIQIRNLSKNGVKFKELLTMFDIKKSMLSYVLNRTFWKHVV